MKLKTKSFLILLFFLSISVITNKIFAQEKIYTLNEVDILPTFEGCPAVSSQKVDDWIGCFYPKLEKLVGDSILAMEQQVGMVFSGVIKVKFTIDNLGSTSNVQILNSPHPILKKGTRDVLNSLQDLQPAKLDDYLVSMSLVLEIDYTRFKMSQVTIDNDSLFPKVLEILNTNDYSIKKTFIEQEEAKGFQVKKFNNGLIYTAYIEYVSAHGNMIKISKILYSEILNKELLTTPQLIEIDGLKYNCGSPEFVPLSQEFYFSTNNKKPTNGMRRLSLYRGKLVNNQIKNIEKLDFSNQDFELPHLTISDDGLTLIFNCNLDGELKFYESKRQSIHEEWGDIYLIDGIKGKILGFPNLLSNNYLTYSKQIPDRGYDIFIAKKVNSQWIEIGSWDQLNSPFDDLGVEMIDATSGYFSSNRDSDGQVDKIYYFNVADEKE